MNILCLMTGGTMGSTLQNGSINVRNDAAISVVSYYEKQYGSDVKITVKKPYWILSENVSLNHWNLLLEELEVVDASVYDGVIVTHGSDTLSYSCAIIGECLGICDIPILFTASNYPLEDERSNGLNNFTACVDCIRAKVTPGVYAIYQQKNKRIFVYEAADINEADPLNDEFSSFCGTPFGEIRNHELVSGPRSVASSERKKNIRFVNDIALFRPYPGMRFDYIYFHEKPAAVLFYLYHSGTASTSGEGNVLEFIRRLHDDGIKIYLASYKDIHAAQYDTANELLSFGAVALENMSLPAAYAKVLVEVN